MASNYTGLGVQLMTTGEKAGLWGGLTNTNWDIIEQISGGYTTQAVTDGADTDLSVSDGSTGATLAHRIIELTGSLSAGRNVTIPLREYDELKSQQNFIKDPSLISIIDKIEELVRALRKHIIRK